jgi:hypothetical protein
MSNCLSAVDTTRLLLSVFSAMAVMSCPFLSINFCITCTASEKSTFTDAQLTLATTFSVSHYEHACSLPFQTRTPTIGKSSLRWMQIVSTLEVKITRI